VGHGIQAEQESRYSGTSLGDSALTAPVMVMFRQHFHAKGKFTNRVEANALSEDDEKSGCVV
jgi:hypothetical protein